MSSQTATTGQPVDSFVEEQEIVEEPEIVDAKIKSIILIGKRIYTHTPTFNLTKVWVFLSKVPFIVMAILIGFLLTARWHVGKYSVYCFWANILLWLSAALAFFTVKVVHK